MSKKAEVAAVGILAGVLAGGFALTTASASYEPSPVAEPPAPVKIPTSVLEERENTVNRSSRSEDREDIRIAADHEQIRRINERIRERKQERREERREERRAARIAARQAARQEAAAEDQTQESTQSSDVSTQTTGLTGVWHDLAMCESGLNPRAYNPAGPWYGLFQFAQGTWESVGGTGDPRDASVSEQLMRAQTLQSRSGWGPWPDCASQLGLL